MSIFFKARSGNFSFSVGILLIRVSIGLLFLFAGAKKVLNLQDFIKSVQETGQMNDTIAFVLAFILPFMEMLFGGLFIIGLFTPVSAFFISCMSISFLLILGTGHYELPFSYNFIILASSIAVMFTGAGYISFDALIDKKKIPESSSNGVFKESEIKTEKVREIKVDQDDIVIEDKKEMTGPDKPAENS